MALDSLTGTLLLREVRRRFGVDVAAEDLNLDALATLGTLAAFVAGRAGAVTTARDCSRDGRCAERARPPDVWSVVVRHRHGHLGLAGPGRARAWESTSGPRRSRSRPTGTGTRRRT